MKLIRLFLCAQLSVFLMITAFCPTTLLAQSGQYTSSGNPQQYGANNPQQFRQVLIELMQGIEEAAGLERNASQAISASSDEDMRILYDFWKNKEQFIDAAQNILGRIQAAQTLTGSRYPVTPKALSAAYSPDYPMGYPYAYLKLFGIIDSPDDRCSADWLDYYRSAIAGAEASLYFFERLSAIAQCDPIGFVCVSFAIPVETAKLILQTAKVPLTLCDAQDKGVDSAEIEAGYENTVTILTDLAAQASIAGNIASALAAHDAQIKGTLAALSLKIENQLTTHDTAIKNLLQTHDTNIKNFLQNILANQAEIIKLLKTPQGRRPGWEIEGY
ncbi:MAG: hypothetical protein A2V86_00570 [Deltaproteobacteria bacterium RBG_16_49_23]|nr:MAG: hypothetical protein A2V86_00570 [Deltaproteobacteria bacterium RBG_16_49_23]